MADSTHKWFHKAIIYQIYPRSFYDSNGDGIGDLQGIIERLDYLNGTSESLCVNAIWLSPIFKSPMADFGYDVSDYQDIDPIFGNLEIFDSLIKEAHQREIKVLMDFIPNHTSDQHPWFIESRSSENNPKRNWYLWAKPKPNGEPPNNWLSVFGGSGWELDPITGSYYFHSFLKEQPDLNWRNPAVLEAMKDVLRFWLDRGVDGFRMDAVYHMVKDSQLEDNPSNPNFIPGTHDPYWAQLNINSFGRPETLDILGEFCRVLGEYPDKFMVTEVYAPFEEVMKFYRICSNHLHSPFNFNLLSLPWDAGQYRAFIDQFEAALLPEDIPNYVLGNHDKSRLASRVGQDRARLLAMLALTVRGMPFIYYGDELGMEDVDIPPELVQDPFEKRVPGFKLGRDPGRTPMQWDSSANAGFSPVQPWLPVSPEFRKYNVEAELADSRSMLNLYRNLIRLRAKHPALEFGSYQSIDTGNQEVFGYIRKHQTTTLLILLNFSEQPQAVSLPDLPGGTILCNTYLNRQKDSKIILDQLMLSGYEGILLKQSGSDDSF